MREQTSGASGAGPEVRLTCDTCQDRGYRPVLRVHETRTSAAVAVWIERCLVCRKYETNRQAFEAVVATLAMSTAEVASTSLLGS
jgi:hypothetical protein